MKLLLSVVSYLILNEVKCTVLLPKRSVLKLAETTNSETNENQSPYKKDNATKNVLYLPMDDSDESLSALYFCDFEENLHKFISFDNKTQTIRVTWNRTKVGEKAILPNICSVENGLPLQRRCMSYSRKAWDFKWESYNNASILIDCRISMFCKPEIFQHYLIQSNGETVTHQNTWKKAKIGELSSLRDVCLKPNGLHLTRKCVYDPKEYRAKWASIDHLKDFKCLSGTRHELISRDLNTLHDNLATTNFLLKDMFMRRQTATDLLTLLEKPKIKLLPADVQMTSDILKVLVTDNQDAELSKDVVKITHNLMSTDPVVLRMSAEVNATNCLLETFENYMDALTEQFVSHNHCNVKIPSLNAVNTTATANNMTMPYKILNLSHMGVYAHEAPNISVFFVNPICANISGIAIYHTYQHQTQVKQQQQQQSEQRHMVQSIHYDSFNDFHYRFIFMNESINDLLQESSLELASFLPASLWLKLESTFPLSASTPVIVFKVYAHDGLFVEQNLLRSRKPFSRILSISLPGFEGQLPENLPFILHNNNRLHNVQPNENTGCGYWNYSTWISNGVATGGNYAKVNNDLILCSTSHLTQFSYLIGGGFRQNDLSDEILVTAVHQKALDIISLIGCTLSLLGLLGIWITACVFKSWRSQASNKVLLNMCVALTLQMVLFLFVNTDDVANILVEQHNYVKCIVLGALMQYSLLVLFTWMLIVAVLQFQRYVTVIGIQRPKHYIIKSAIVAWGLPLIPTLLVAFLDSKSYIPSNYQLVTDTGICYPSGSGLHFGVILPISIVVVANLAIFVYVFYSISHTLSKTMQRNEKQMIIKQIRLSILLFFLLGLSWIFGIFAFMKAGIVFSYLFCLTATLQGFVLFIYFVILDQNTRESWSQLLCCACGAESHKKKMHEIQSMATASTSLTQDMSSTRDN
ncbi:hypothetical protein DOY81_006645 [Sarcophaga bullata]|nr:hypothetical protein DOY81_006645 [Sarcophaga bullata]